MYVIHRLAGKSDDVGYSDLYSDISDRYDSALYNTITADDFSRERTGTRNNSQHCPCERIPEVDTLTRQVSQNTLRPKNKITLEIQLEGTTATSVELIPKGGDDQSYLHAITNSYLSC
jgi:hypothetical protein